MVAYHDPLVKMEAQMIVVVIVSEDRSLDCIRDAIREIGLCIESYEVTVPIAVIVRCH